MSKKRHRCLIIDIMLNRIKKHMRISWLCVFESDFAWDFEYSSLFLPYSISVVYIIFVDLHKTLLALSFCDDWSLSNRVRIFNAISMNNFEYCAPTYYVFGKGPLISRKSTMPELRMYLRPRSEMQRETWYISRIFLIPDGRDRPVLIFI